MFGSPRLFKFLYMGLVAASFLYVLRMLLLPKINSEIMQFLGKNFSYAAAHSKYDREVRDIGFKNHGFNALASDNIGIFRDIPDTRMKICQKVVYDNDLPSASIIMCYYNEHKMTLLRSIKSILDRTPTKYLKEIILVDDYSDFSDLLNGLMEDVRKLDSNNKVRRIRMVKREGLIRARVIGARISTGDVLVFLDSHIEVNKNWLQPLLHIVKHENSVLAVPIVDIIHQVTFEYFPSPLVRGGFNWDLRFKWEVLPTGFLKDEKSFAEPFKTATMPGGVFAVDKKYFIHIGEYDMGMDVWGGENLEISFRVWQCGGAIKMIPCSRVGHIFREHRSSYDLSEVFGKNSLRVAHVWMDEYKDYIYLEKISQSVDYGNIDERLQLREKLNCFNFSWYLHNVYPELAAPTELETTLEPVYIRRCLIRLSGTNFCFSVVGLYAPFKKLRLSLEECSKTRNQIWYETENSEIIIDKNYCLRALVFSPLPAIGKCYGELGEHKWVHTNLKNTSMYNMASGTCLRASEVKEGAILLLDLCSKNVPNTWDIISID